MNRFKAWVVRNKIGNVLWDKELGEAFRYRMVIATSASLVYIMVLRFIIFPLMGWVP